MRKILLLAFLFFSNNLSAYNEDEIICVASLVSGFSSCLKSGINPKTPSEADTKTPTIEAIVKKRDAQIAKTYFL